jgi:hypothetical protein
MTNRAIAVMLIGLIGAGNACTSSSTSSGIQTGSNNYDSQYRAQTAATQQTYDAKQAEKKEGDAAITVMQLGLETGDVYPGEDYYVHAVVDNPTDRKNLQYVWSTTEGELTEVPESQRGRLQTLVEDVYSKSTPEAGAAGTTDAAPLPQTGNTPAGATTLQPSEGVVAPVEQPIMPSPMAGPTVSVPNGTPSTQVNDVTGGPKVPLSAGPEPAKPTGGAVKTEDARMTSNHKAVYEKRIVAGPEEDSYFTAEDQAEISYDTQAPAADEVDALQEVADEQSDSIAARARSAEFEVEESPQEIRNGQRRLVTRDQRDEPEGSPNAVEGGIAGDPYDTGDNRDRGWDRKTTAELDRERGLYGGADLTADLDAAEADSGELRSTRRGTSAEEAKEVTADQAYEKFSLVTDEPFVRWTPNRPGESKLFVKVRWKTDDLTEATALPVDVRLREPTVQISDDEFPDMVREDEPLFIRIDGDNLPAFDKGLLTLSFDPDLLSFREAELGEFFDDAPGSELFYAQPDKLAGKVILAVEGNTELSNLSGGGPLLYVKFKAKRDIESRDATQLALVQDTASQYVLDASGDNILPLATEHGKYQTALVLPPRFGGQSGVERALIPGEQTPNQKAAAAEQAKLDAAAAAAGTAPAAAAAATVTVPTTEVPLPATGPTPTVPNPNPQQPAPILNPPVQPQLQGDGTKVPPVRVNP